MKGLNVFHFEYLLSVCLVAYMGYLAHDAPGVWVSLPFGVWSTYLAAKMAYEANTK